MNEHADRIRDDILANLTIAEFCDVVAQCFSVDRQSRRGHIIEMHWDEHGRFRGVTSRAGRLGTEELRRLGGFAA